MTSTRSRGRRGELHTPAAPRRRHWQLARRLSAVARRLWIERWEQRARVSLGPPWAPPHLTKSEAIAVARRTCPLLSMCRFKVEYGSYYFNGVVRDVWKFTVRHVNIPHPGGVFPRGDGTTTRPPPRMHTYVIFIDDKTGEGLLATGY